MLTGNESHEAPKELRVLLAEDDELNQVLSRGIFKKIGWTLDIVDNGVRAIEKLQQSQYDVVLMDVQMPVLDGYQTTIKIRTELPPPLSTIPIIAVTAHSRQSEIEKCRIAGMNDYIYKPFNPDDLFAKIISVIEDVNFYSDEKPKNRPLMDNIINLKNLYLTCGDNPDIVKNVLTVFLTDTPPRIKELRLLLEAEDWPNFQVICHKMKSSFALIGSEDIRKALEEMEHDCMKNTVDARKFGDLVNKVETLNTRVIKEIKQNLEI